MSKKETFSYATFGRLFKLALLTILPVALYTFVLMFSKVDRNNRILSLILMLLYAFIYVILLYIVFTKLNIFFDSPEDLDKKGIRKKPILATAFIYEIRFAIRSVILLYVFVKGCKILMLPEYNDYAILVPVVLALLFLAHKGIRGYVCFLDVIFWFVLIVFGILLICSLNNLDLSKLTELYSFGIENSISYTIGTVMSRGYIYLLPFAMLELVVCFYMVIQDRKRGMLAVSVGIPGILAVIASVFVVNVLGFFALNTDEKNILNIVGAMEYPGGDATRLGLLACNLFVIFGITVIGAHFVYAFKLMGQRISRKTRESIWWTLSYGIGIIILYAVFQMLVSGRNVYSIVATYIAVIDIPLSVIVPAFVGRGRAKPGKYVAGILGGILLLCFLSGCSYNAMEDVDYLRVIIIENQDGDLQGQADQGRGSELSYQYTFVVNALSGKENGSITEETVFKSGQTDFHAAIEKYNEVHAKTLDISHTEYLVVGDSVLLSEVYPDIISDFTTNYIEVIYETDLLQQIGEQDIKDYISSHYHGKNLASIDIESSEEKEKVRLYLD